MSRGTLRRWQELEKRLPVDCDLVGAEVGTWRGQMSNYMLQRFPRLTLHCVDRWDAVPDGHQYRESGGRLGCTSRQKMIHAWEMVRAMASEFSPRQIVLRGESGDIAKTMTAESLDFIFIDADHSYEGTLADLVAWGPLVKPGGLISGHDYGNVSAEWKWGVRRAVDQYVAEYCGGAAVELGDDFTYFFTRPEKGGIKK